MISPAREIRYSLYVRPTTLTYAAVKIFVRRDDQWRGDRSA